MLNKNSHKDLFHNKLPSELSALKAGCVLTQTEVDAILSLFARQQEFEEENKSILEKLNASFELIKKLTEQVNLDSRNSGLSPKTDKPRTKHQKKKDRKEARAKQKAEDLANGIVSKKVGGQVNHKGSTRLQQKNVPEENTVHHLPEKCSCGCTNFEAAKIKRQKIHELIDICSAQVEYVHHILNDVKCPVCKKIVKCEPPAEAPHHLQFGNRFLVTLAFLAVHEHIALKRLSYIHSYFFGNINNISPATCIKAINLCAKWVRPIMDAYFTQLMDSNVLRVDETGIPILDKNWWVHGIFTEYITYYRLDEKRGYEAIIKNPGNYRGKLVHDCWAAYFKLPTLHGLCCVHLIRELKIKEKWAEQLIKLLLKIKSDKESRIAEGINEFTESELKKYHDTFDALIKQGLSENPIPENKSDRKKRGKKTKTKVRNLLERLEKYSKNVLFFAYDFSIPFDNNLSEQGLRMVNVHMNISNCMRTQQGAENFLVVYAFLDTMRKLGQNPFDMLLQAVNGTFVMPNSNTCKIHFSQNLNL